MIHRYRPLYSACNEDTRSELRALDIGPDDSVVAICAGGGRVLSLLSEEPRRVVAIDRREDQLFQLELKASAMAALDYESFIRFLGLAPSPARLDLYASVRSGLSPSARRYWDRRTSLVRDGVLYAGRCERALTRFVQLFRRIGRLRWIEPYFAASSLDEQRALEIADGGRLRRLEPLWRFYCQPWIVFAATQDPGFLRSTQGSVGAYLNRRFLSWIDHQLVRDSFMLQLIYYGEYGPQGCWPPYLRPEAFDRARKALDRLELWHGSLADLSARVRLDGRVKWSLSDVSAWCSEEAYHDLLRRAVLHGDAGSRLCSRHFAARRTLPADLRRSTRPLTDLAARLDATDASLFWTFDVNEYGHGPA